MRPISKGDCPQEGGVNIAFVKYEYAREPLIKRLGEYCSYCEMHLEAGLAVEHKLPKGVTRYRHLEREWSNFLLACPNCNSTKLYKDIEEDELFWPDQHNTFYALEYSQGGGVSPNRSLSEAEAIKASRLISLVGLDKRAGNLRTMSDRRWLNRQKAWDLAERKHTALQVTDTQELRETIADLAKSTGYFSVWMTVFANDSDMLQRIMEQFPGTARACFNAGKCIASTTR